MARPKKVLPTYGTTVIKGVTYYRTRITDADGKRVSLYARTPEELTEKVEDARRQIADATFRAENPTVREYCEKWLTMHAAHVRETTLADYTSKVKIYIVEPLGDRYMSEITPDDVNMAITKAAKQSVSIYRSVQMLYKTIFASAEESHVIDKSPCKNLNPKGGKPAKEKQALTAAQVKTLLDAVDGLPPYPFVMIGLYAGLRREEILALQWDCVDLDGKTPTIRVRRSWHTVHNRPVITDELKTKAARRDRHAGQGRHRRDRLRRRRLRSGGRAAPRRCPRAAAREPRLSPHSQEGGLPHARSAHEGAQEVRPQGRPSRAAVLQALNKHKKISENFCFRRFLLQLFQFRKTIILKRSYFQPQ